MNNKDRGELYRDSNNGKIGGVCAGLAHYLGWEAWLVRVLLVSGVLLGMTWFIVVYIAAMFILNKKPLTEKYQEDKQSKSDYAKKGQGIADDDKIINESIKIKSRIWQSGEPPQKAFRHIKRKFNRLEKELQLIEQHVTSTEFTVSREINRL